MKRFGAATFGTLLLLSTIEPVQMAAELAERTVEINCTHAPCMDEGRVGAIYLDTSKQRRQA